MHVCIRYRGFVFTRKCGKVRFVVFAPVLVIPEVCWLAWDRFQADKLPALSPYRLPCPYTCAHAPNTHTVFKETKNNVRGFLKYIRHHTPQNTHIHLSTHP